MTNDATPPAGWYADPERPGFERYWGGEQWTDERRPVASRGNDAFGDWDDDDGGGWRRRLSEPRVLISSAMSLLLVVVAFVFIVKRLAHSSHKGAAIDDP